MNVPLNPVLFYKSFQKGIWKNAFAVYSGGKKGLRGEGKRKKGKGKRKKGKVKSKNSKVKRRSIFIFEFLLFPFKSN